MPVLARLEDWCVRITRPLAFTGVIGMLVVAGIIMVDVLLRWVASAAIPALNEVVSMVFAVAVAACLPAGVAQGVHLTIDLLEGWLRGRLAAWLSAVGDLFLLSFFALLAWRVALYAGSLAEQGRTTIILRWPHAPFMYCVAVLLASAAVVQAVVAVNAIGRALAPAPETAPPPVPRAVRSAVPAGVIFFFLILFALGIADFAMLSRWARDYTGPNGASFGPPILTPGGGRG